jgi:DNA-binding SARP family transcriptional activator/Flp pilus assembly protein TadD/DNA-binding XRE family transcriptional regulator
MSGTGTAVEVPERRADTFLSRPAGASVLECHNRDGCPQSRAPGVWTCPETPVLAADWIGDGMGELGSAAGELIRTGRRRAGLTQRQLADRAGVSVGTVRDLEQGRTTRLRAESARRLANVLRLDRQQTRDLSLAAQGNDGIAAAVAAPGDVAKVRIGVLGPLAAWRSGVPVTLGPPLQRAVLGLLALHPGTGLSRSAIIDVLWRDDPPATAVPMVQSYISRLRRLLGPVCLLTSNSGYRLQPLACDLDLVAFERLVQRARDARATGELAVACETYEEALALWRGDPLADAEVLRDHPAIAQLRQQRADAVTSYAEAASAAGSPDRALPQLRELAAREPFNERVNARLMIALAASGQQVAALTIYDEVRQRLDDQLGVRPGAELAEAHAQVLSQQIPAARASRATRSPGPVAASRDAPRQLPGAVANFTGRTAELAVLDGLLDGAAQKAPGTIVISAVGGTAGVGKTALVVHWAHRVADQFPDGQLYVNLRGYDPAQPVRPTDALAGFLRSLGVAGQDIPEEEAERAARYRSLLAGQRMLVVLDNAGSAEQVRPLLPGNPHCPVVVTSRDALTALVARDGAQRLDLDLLPLDEAVGLLRALIGARVDADTQAAVLLASQCCRLPLALRVAAELATARPAVPLAELVGELADQQRRLDLLDAGGDARSAARTVFSWSYRHLDAAAGRAFRLLGLHPGPDFDRYAVAALADETAERAGRLLEQLARAHLTQPAGPGRYGMHDLLRSYARGLTAARDSEERRAAQARLFDYYLDAAAAAMDTVLPAERDRRPRFHRSAALIPPLTDPDAALAWLDAQRSCLVAAVTHAAAEGWPGHASRLAATLFRYLDNGGHFSEAITIHTHALLASGHTGDRIAEATALVNLASVDLRQGRYEQAGDQLQSALSLFREGGDQIGEARALANLGVADMLKGRYEQATAHLQLALPLLHKAGNRSGEATTLGHLGTVCLRQGRYQQAADYYQQALDICRASGNRSGEAYAVGNLANVNLRQGRYQQAAADLREALALFRKTGDQAGEAQALVLRGDLDLRQGRYQQAAGDLREALALFRKAGNQADEAQALVLRGDLNLRQGRYQQAAGDLREALALFRKTGDQAGEAQALDSLGAMFLATGRPADARAQHGAALKLAGQIGEVYEQARAHDGLARAYQAVGNSVRARHHWRHALAYYVDLGAPEAGQVRAQLAAADNHDHQPGSSRPRI